MKRIFPLIFFLLTPWQGIPQVNNPGEDPWSKASFFKPMFGNYENLCGHNPLETYGAQGVVGRLDGICRTVMAGPICQQVEEGARLRCDHSLSEAHQGSLWDLFVGCGGGFFDAGADLLRIMSQILQWIISPIDTVSASTDFVGSTLNYLGAEYERAYAESSWPFRQLKAAKKMGETILRTLYNTISGAIATEYYQYGCLNFRARQGLFCQVVGNIFIPGKALNMIRPILVTGGRSLAPVLTSIKGFGDDFLKMPETVRKAARTAEEAARVAEEARDGIRHVQQTVDNVANAPRRAFETFKNAVTGKTADGASDVAGATRGHTVTGGSSASSRPAATTAQSSNLPPPPPTTPPPPAATSPPSPPPRGFRARIRARGEAFARRKAEDARRWVVEKTAPYTGDISSSARRLYEGLQRNAPAVSATSYSGRTVVARVQEEEAPEIEGRLMFFSGSGDLRAGHFVRSRVGQAISFPLEGRTVEGDIVADTGQSIRVRYKDQYGFSREATLRDVTE